MDMSYSEMNNMVREAREKRRLQTEALSKKKLMDIVKSKLTTTMIGALSAFEKEFGHLWGMGKDDRNLSSHEIDIRKKWEIVRTEVLNNGNNQLRAILNEISQYSMKWEKYRVDFLVQKGENK